MRPPLTCRRRYWFTPDHARSPDIDKTRPAGAAGASAKPDRDLAARHESGGEGGAKALEERRHHLALLGGVDEIEQAAGAGLAADIDIGGDVEIVEEVELLMNEGDAGSEAVGDGE